MVYGMGGRGFCDTVILILVHWTDDELFMPILFFYFTLPLVRNTCRCVAFFPRVISQFTCICTSRLITRQCVTSFVVQSAPNILKTSKLQFYGL